MKLITPFAWERYLEGVTSGIRATTGVRQIAMLSIKVIVQVTKSGRRASLDVHHWDGNHRGKEESQRGDRGAGEHEWQTPSDLGAGAVG